MKQLAVDASCLFKTLEQPQLEQINLIAIIGFKRYLIKQYQKKTIKKEEEKKDLSL